MRAVPWRAETIAAACDGDARSPWRRVTLVADLTRWRAELDTDAARRLLDDVREGAR